MPHEKTPRKSVFWWTCRRAWAHCGFLLAYLVNGILSVVAASLLFLLFASEIPVPGVLTRTLEANLEAEGISQRIKSIQFDSGGRILLNQVRLYSKSYDEPLLTVDQVLVTMDLQALLFGRIQAAALQISNATLLSPSVVSPTGVPREVLSDLSGSIHLASGGIRIENIRLRAGQIRAMVTGRIQLPERKETTESRPSISAAIAELIRQIPRIIRIQNSLTPLQAPIARIRIEPNRNEGYDANMDILSEGYNGADGTTATGLDATIAIATHRGKIKSINVSGRVASAKRAGLVEASSILLRGRWDRLPSIQNPYPDRVEVGIGALTFHKATLRNLYLKGQTAVDGRLELQASSTFGSEPISIEGRVDPGSGTAIATIEGRAGDDWLDLAGQVIGSEIGYYADLSTRPVYRARVAFEPGWSWSRVDFEAMASDLVARGVRLDSAHAKGHATPEGVTVEEIVVRQGKTRAEASYQDTFATRDYRFLIRGAVRPLTISPWFGPWWEKFWSDLEVSDEGGDCDISIHGNWFGVRKTLVTGHFAADNVAVKSLRFDHVHGNIFIRPHYYDIFDATAIRPEGTIKGGFQLLFKPGEKLPVEQHFAANSTIDLKSVGPLFGEGGIQMLAPYDYDTPPAVVFNGTILRTGQVWDTDISIDINTLQPFSYEDFPLESLRTTVRILNNRVELPGIEATYAGGSLTAEALVDNGILSFDATLKDASFQDALSIFGQYTRRDDPAPPEGESETRFEDRNLGGRLNISLVAQGGLGNFSSYKGAGKFDISDAELGKIHLFGVLSAALQSTILRFSTLRFTEASSTFQIDRNEVFFPDLQVTGPLAAIKSEGSYDIPTGNLDFQARFFPFDRGGMPVFTILDTFLNPFSYFFEITMTGSLKTPKISVSLGGAANTRPFSQEDLDAIALPPTEQTNGAHQGETDTLESE